MWRSVFLHEFLDGEIRHFQALAGNLTSSSLTLTPVPNPPLITNTVQITPGRGFEYVLAETLDQVIGISGRVRLRFPMQGEVGPASILRVGDLAEFRLRPQIGGAVNADTLEYPASGLLRIGPTEVDLGRVVLAHRRFVNLRFDWHTSGQARLLQDGRLVGYHNAVAPTAQLTVANVVFGLPDASPALTNSRYEIGRVFVRVLRRSDSLAAVSRLLPDIPVPADDLFERCRVRATLDLLARLDRLRRFMALVNQTLSQPWSEAAGPPRGPFTPEAVTAHRRATTAVVALGRMLRTGDFSTAEEFLGPFTEFLRILHDALPAEFEALAAEIVQPPALPTGCESVLTAVLEQHRQDMEPLLNLLTEAFDRVRDLTGGS